MDGDQLTSRTQSVWPGRVRVGVYVLRSGLGVGGQCPPKQHMPPRRCMSREVDILPVPNLDHAITTPSHKPPLPAALATIFGVESSSPPRWCPAHAIDAHAVRILKHHVSPAAIAELQNRDGAVRGSGCEYATDFMWSPRDQVYGRRMCAEVKDLLE